MKIPFAKMHGAGNDFVVVDDRAGRFPAADAAFVRRMAARRTGVGCEGIVLLRNSAMADIRMCFLNPDGSEVGMCGNGARCLARFAHDRGAAPAEMAIETRSGTVRAKVLGGGTVRLALPDPSDWRLGLDAGLEQEVDFVNTGVPHAVARVARLEALDVPTLGSALRRHALFAPEGTNADFVRVESDGSLSMRTYERGVEAETLACGTGAVAAAVVAARRGWVDLPVAVHCVGGYDLVVDSDSSEGTTLQGGAEYVFEGEIEYGNRI